jgi:LPXTG-motif cell wall-anchored protein
MAAALASGSGKAHNRLAQLQPKMTNRAEDMMRLFLIVGTIGLVLLGLWFSARRRSKTRT